MQNIKIIQLIISTIIIAPSLIHLVIEPFKRKYYRRYRIMLLLITSLLGLLINMILSVIVINMDSSYSNIKYSEFYELLNIFKFTGKIYLGVTGVILLFFGTIYALVYTLNASVFNFVYYETDVKHINFDKFTFIDKFFKYPFLYIESNYYVKRNKKSLLLSKFARKEYQKYMKRYQNR